jgi:putative transposase
VVGRVRERTRWRRGNFTHQHSRRIVNPCELSALEDWSVHQMTQNHCLAKSIQGAFREHPGSIHDVAWGQFARLLSSKAAGVGRRVVAVNTAYSSQECSSCGHRKTELSLADRTSTCSWCGVVLDRDRNASLTLLAVGQHCLASAYKPTA